MTRRRRKPLERILHVGDRTVRPRQGIAYITKTGIRERARVLAVNPNGSLRIEYARIAQKDVPLDNVEFSLQPERGKATFWRMP